MNRTKESMIKLRWAVRIIMGIGFCASIMGNALHAQFNIISIAIAVAAPTILFLTFEMVSRVPISETLVWYRKLPRPLATTAIAGMAAFQSFKDQNAMIYRYSNHDATAAILLPLCVDGLLVVASVTVYELTARIDMLLAHEQGAAVRVPKPKDTDKPTSTLLRTPELTAKQRIAEIWSKAPTLSIKEIAGVAGTSYNYAYSIVKQLKEMDSEEAELILA